MMHQWLVVHVTDLDWVMESDQIIYDTTNEVVIAGDESAKKRVNITITPENIKKQ